MLLIVCGCECGVSEVIGFGLMCVMVWLLCVMCVGGVCGVDVMCVWVGVGWDWCVVCDGVCV